MHNSAVWQRQRQQQQQQQRQQSDDDNTRRKLQWLSTTTEQHSRSTTVDLQANRASFPPLSQAQSSKLQAEAPSSKFQVAALEDLQLVFRVVPADEKALPSQRKGWALQTVLWQDIQVFNIIRISQDLSFVIKTLYKYSNNISCIVLLFCPHTS